MEHSVTIKSDTKSIHLFAKNNKLARSAVNQFFPTSSGLTYTLNGETFGVDVANDHYILRPDVDEYNTFIPDAGSTARKRFHDMLNEMDLKKHEETANKKSKHTNVPIGKKKFTKRVLYVVWRHRESPTDDFSDTIGSKTKKEITLNRNEDYTLNDIKNQMISLFKTPTTQHIFSNSSIFVGTADDKVIYKFEDLDHHDCGFWDFTRTIRSQDHRLTLHLMTTYRPNQESFENLPIISIKKPAKRIDTLSKVEQNAAEEKNKTLPSPSFSTLSLRSSQLTVVKSNYQHQGSNSSSSTENPLELQKTLVTAKSDVKKIYNGSSTNQKSVVFKKPVDIEKGKFSNFLQEQIYELTKLQLRVPIITMDDVNLTSYVIGKGGQGCIVKGFWKSTEVAVKSMKVSLKNQKLILREIKLLETAVHQNIIPLLAVYPSLNHYNMVMEYFISKSLEDLLFGDLHEISGKEGVIAKQVCVGIAFLHTQMKYPVVHRDVKPANILVNNVLHVKICDLGLSKAENLCRDLQSTNVNQVRGTYVYMAPEILLNGHSATTASDIWAVGCTLLELYTKKYAWDIPIEYAFQMGEYLCKTFRTKPLPKFIEEVPGFLKKELKQCFHYDVEKRATITNLLCCFNERF